MVNAPVSPAYSVFTVLSDDAFCRANETIKRFAPVQLIRSISRQSMPRTSEIRSGAYAAGLAFQQAQQIASSAAELKLAADHGLIRENAVPA
jgi:hypothetical protein